MADTQYTSGFQAGKDYGCKQEHLRTLEAMQGYFDLTQMPDEDDVVESNPAWDSGYQAAMAIVRNCYKPN
jgi:hypothetical protein